MDENQKILILEQILDCMKQADDLVSDDDEKEDIIIGLGDLVKPICALPTTTKTTVKRLWLKSWRTSRADRGSFSFLSNELLLNDEAAYKNYLRVTKTQFVFLLSLVEEGLTRSNTQMRRAISPAEKLAMTLRFLASGETFQSLDYQTRLSKSFISNTVPEVCGLLVNQLKLSYLKFPSSIFEWEAIAKEFAIKWQFPNCIGALDGKHIQFRSYRKDGAFYHNYKGTNSIVLMALVDANCKFLFVDIGCNGRNNDAGVFNQTKLSTVLREGKDIPPNAVVGNGRCLPYVVVGDDAFPMQTHLMKPYPYHTDSAEKQVYNKRLSRARHVVEHAFGMLSNRFRVLLAPINLRAEKVETITFTCCVLHNYLVEGDENFMSSIQNYTPVTSAGTSGSTFNPQRGQAETIRQQFTAYFNNEGKLYWME